MAKQYGTKSLFEKVFGGKLFPKGTGGILPKYDESLNKAKSETSIKNYKSNRAASDMMKAGEKKAAERASAISKMENMISAAKRDTAKTKPGKSKIARDKRKVKIAPAGSFPKKKEPKLDADTVKSYKKRIKYMEGRKAKGKNYSKANLSKLKAELAAN